MAVCVAALSGGVSTAVSDAQDASAPAAPSPPAAATWREAPDYLALFVARPYRDAYRAFVTPLELDAALHTIASDDDAMHPTGSWTARQENPLDAFGTGGTYDRWKLARLFGSQRPGVARGPRGRNGVVEESWTLIGRYPVTDLSRLEPGTLLIILRVP